MILEMVIFSALLFAFSGIPGLCFWNASAARQRQAETMSLCIALLGSACGLAAIVAFFVCDSSALSLPIATFPWFSLDAIAAFFLLSLFFVGGMCSWYGWGYFSVTTEGNNAHTLRFTLGMLLGSMVMIFISAHAMLFLIMWEVMALAAFFLIMTLRHRDNGVERAGFVYLAATHTGTLSLIALFALMGAEQGHWFFPAEPLLLAGYAAPVLLLTGLFGFGLKAGLMPLHIWLPSAHASAPSHISALLSGVVIKSGIYGLIRLNDWVAVIPPWWGWTLLVLGAFSAFFGVAYALAQHDIKRLLAYHSVENIGIILIGVALFYLGRIYDHPAMQIFGLAGALLHVLNHGLFKSLLFLSAGSVIHMGQTREINAYGGVLRHAPWTGIAFLGGAASICALPPLNGFISEWFVYLGLFETLTYSHAISLPALLAAGILAMAGALALACFVKVFGTVFLGESRQIAPEKLHDPGWSMRLPMGLLTLACVLIGLLPSLLVNPLLIATNDVTGVLAAITSSLTWFSVTGLLVWGVAGIAIWWLVRRARYAPRSSTWGCGYLHPTVRMQYTASSFAQTLVHLFRWGVGFHRSRGVAEGVLPAAIAFHTESHDKILDSVLLPTTGQFQRGCSAIKSWLTRGFVGIYLLYIALTLAALLFWTFWGGVA
ncbi:proton-conducting transporter membrane subunit [Chrysiogenes arsenatis]|uniref:proton-conducting transporter transmembrane domain-containing protein n=1 Tax=Chrysiogenes arsenatis TaxID=309797 RepID=UPI00041FC03F|nr:proton-conducting transporter membrane subunit [Chrysiogenes arsenatis]